MKIIRNSTGGSCVLVLGTFDGVHLGHQALLARGAESARELGLPLYACTFDPHPLAVLRPENAPPLLTTLAERAEWMGQYGADGLIVIPFTREMAETPPEVFLREMAERWHPGEVICGFNFTFGARGSGNGALLTAEADHYGYRACVIPEVLMDGEPVSSTRIRGLLASGDAEGAARLLGHPYQLSGPVVDGKHMGRVLGYPTANVHVPSEKQLPAFGVYACEMRAAGKTYPAVVNVGRHPTLPEGGVTVEAFLLDASLDLYGQQVSLSLLRYLRPERRFESVEELEAQIGRDTAEAGRLFHDGMREDSLS